jgi:hypothetical protein
MADLSKFKRKSLGPPPAFAEASANLRAPETAPIAPSEPETPSREPRPHIDGRSARRTGRTRQFSTRVSAEFDERFRTIAARDNLQINVLLEKALDAYEQERN